jgi:hypothetical protein
MANCCQFCSEHMGGPNATDPVRLRKEFRIIKRVASVMQVPRASSASDCERTCTSNIRLTAPWTIARCADLAPRALAAHHPGAGNDSFMIRSICASR